MHPDCTIYNVEQGSDEWHQARNGVLTASEVDLILTPTLKVANNDTTRAHVYEIAAQRISGYTEPTYIGDSMLRGHVDEVKARDLYSDKYEPVEELGFITRSFNDCVIGFSPDGAAIMSSRGIECKSRIQKHQIKTITNDEVPKEHIIQIQTGLLVTGWDAIDYISYSGGLPMWVIECKPIAEYQDAILNAAIEFDAKVNEVIDKYLERLASARFIIETERNEITDDVEIYM